MKIRHTSKSSIKREVYSHTNLPPKNKKNLKQFNLTPTEQEKEEQTKHKVTKGKK